MKRRRATRFLAAGLLLLAAAVTTVFFLARAEWGRRASARVIRDDGGAIKHVACVASSARRSSLRNARLISDIVDALPAHTKLTILTNDRAAFVVVRNPQPQRVEFLDLPSDAAFTIWPQDPFVVLRQRDGTGVLLASRDFDRADDRLIVQTLAKHLGWELRVSSFKFEGGNIVVGRRHVFIGANTILGNAAELGLSPQQVARKFAAELGRPPLVVGPAPQPIGHLDMMLTPLDEHTVVLADPGWGADLAENQLRSDPDEVNAFERACQQQFFGDPRITHLTDRHGKSIAPPATIGQTLAASNAARGIAHHLDNLAAELTRWGYQVHRVPFLQPPTADPEPATQSAAASTTGPGTMPRRDALPRYPCLTYNNVLLQTAPQQRTVWLPQYGWPVFDDAAAQAWAKLGYRVVPLPGFSTSAMYGGSLRCCVKVLGRDD